jgi:methylmalonyl-CoA mutase N-terminal domain/subunit
MNNIVRVSNQALAAVLGGTQSLHTNGYDEAISLPTEAAAKIALRTQQIIAFESGVTDTVDPLAGSYFIEALTDELEKAAQEYIDKIDAMGGSVKAIEQDYMQQEIARSAYEYQNEIESGERVLVGVNRFTQPEEPALNVFRVDDSIRKMQIQKITTLKNKRDNTAVNNSLEQLEDAAKGTQNLMPFILNAVECYATLGEIADTLRNIFGEY